MRINFIDENLLGQPGLSKYIDPKLNWERNSLSYDACVYTDKMCFGDLNLNKNNYAWIIEPPIINGENYSYIVKQHKNFNKVFSHHINLSEKIDNFIYIPHGGTWLRQEDIALHSKDKVVSCIFSNKNWNGYHRMRHRIYERFKNDSIVAFYGTGCEKPIEHKITGLKHYMFSIVVENSIENDYFTEKLIDCFLAGTIPIYCGTKNVSKYFDQKGIVFFDGDEDLPNILSKIDSVYYQRNIEAIQHNFSIAHEYIHPELKINEYIKQYHCNIS